MSKPFQKQLKTYSFPYVYETNHRNPHFMSNRLFIDYPSLEATFLLCHLRFNHCILLEIFIILSKMSATVKTK